MSMFGAYVSGCLCCPHWRTEVIQCGADLCMRKCLLGFICTSIFSITTDTSACRVDEQWTARVQQLGFLYDFVQYSRATETATTILYPVGGQPIHRFVCLSHLLPFVRLKNQFSKWIHSWDVLSRLLLCELTKIWLLDYIRLSLWNKITAHPSFPSASAQVLTWLVTNFVTYHNLSRQISDKTMITPNLSDSKEWYETNSPVYHLFCSLQTQFKRTLPYWSYGYLAR